MHLLEDGEGASDNGPEDPKHSQQTAKQHHHHHKNHKAELRRHTRHLDLPRILVQWGIYQTWLRWWLLRARAVKTVRVVISYAHACDLIPMHKVINFLGRIILNHNCHTEYQSRTVRTIVKQCTYSLACQPLLCKLTQKKKQQIFFVDNLMFSASCTMNIKLSTKNLPCFYAATATEKDVTLLRKSS